jgi:uncharacterized membrane protein YjjB (DUF3815 family)
VLSDIFKNRFPINRFASELFAELIMLLTKEKSNSTVLPGIQSMFPGPALVQASATAQRRQFRVENF